MKIIKGIREFKNLRNSIENKSIGFTPTMGAIHEGHLDLVRNSKKENDLTIVSIFVNPTQFNEPKDLANYPTPLEKDISLLESMGVDYLFIPSKEELYPDNYSFKVTENNLSHKFCGQHRPGHFDGVLSVVMKLLNLVRADKAYFGEKDYQQLTLIQKMVEAFFMEVQIVAVKTVRETDGLAMSSRNQLLKPEHRMLAANFYKELAKAASAEEAKLNLLRWADSVDYIEDFEGRRLAAIKLGNVRLIDNAEL